MKPESLITTNKLAPIVARSMGVKSDRISIVSIDMAANDVVRVNFEMYMTAQEWNSIKLDEEVADEEVADANAD